MAKPDYKTCAYCLHHIWADELKFHICLKKDDHQPQDLAETCENHKDSKRYGINY